MFSKHKPVFWCDDCIPASALRAYAEQRAEQEKANERLEDLWR
jgi:hypothetical protein